MVQVDVSKVHISITPASHIVNMPDDDFEHTRYSQVAALACSYFIETGYVKNSFELDISTDSKGYTVIGRIIPFVPDSYRKVRIEKVNGRMELNPVRVL